MTAAPPPTDGRRPIKRALVSVYDKSGLDELARALDAAGVAIVSTGSTAKTIAAAGVPVTQVEELTGFPECLDGRVKTLHPKVHAGILADTRNPDHVQQLADLGVEPFDLVVVNLYPFRETVASGASEDECVEQIDIGGPSMVRASAKNHAERRDRDEPGGIRPRRGGAGRRRLHAAERQRLAAEAFVHTASYDSAVASWMGNVVADTTDGTGFPAWTGATFDRAAALRYGENPHQSAALYRHWRPGVASAEQLHGKEMSYNNYVDTDAAVRAAHDHGDQPTVAIIKHANPCGIAVGGTIEEAYERAHATDPVERLRRHHRGQPHRDGGDGGGREAGLHRGHHRARLRARGARDPHGQEEPPHPAPARRHGRGGRPDRDACRSAAACSCRPSTGSTPSCATRLATVTGGDDAATGGSSPVTPRTTRRSPTCSSRGARSAP